ncbi:hypothetical protein V2J09_018832 [Rumex salicifolius]
MDDVFARILNLTSYISSHLVHFIEDILYGFVNGCLGPVGFNIFRDSSSSVSPTDWKNSSECSSSSLKHAEAVGRPRIRPLVSSDLNELTASTGTSLAVNHNYGCRSFSIPGLVLPSLVFRAVLQLSLSSWRCLVDYAQCSKLRVVRLISQVHKTLRGSSDDIGWLQHTPGMDLAKDGTPRFLELLQDIRRGRHVLPDSFVYLLIPGLFSNHSPLYFVSTKRFLSKMGLACHIAKIHSEASVDRNALELKYYVEELFWGSGKRVILLGHSKGGVDAAAALSLYWHDLKDKVGGLALVQSPYGGTPVASDILRSGQIADTQIRRIMELIVCRLIKGDLRALEDLTYDKRREFILRHKLPQQLPLISFHSEASIGPSVLASMTQIAHAELPSLPLPTFLFGRASDDQVQAARILPVIIPISAAMAICALLLLLRYGEKSDGLVTSRDAEVPGSVVVRPDRKLNHAWMVYSAWNKKTPLDSDCSEMCEAILTMLVEIGEEKKMKKE